MSPCAYACSNCLELRLWLPEPFYSASSSASFRMYSYRSSSSRFAVFIAYATALG
ncbi:hypothetical protein BDV98DRAFT_577077 [Pterulicium gracile]|uniref:Uncharacterized protein n=1 Tax=Pterulicium gracile TaxID=1884261 RepID=A0A5C3Q146_9AGAR|nr:hypothetical protein BDV98DRAFT_577077 [Pterula gracilis]